MVDDFVGLLRVNGMNGGQKAAQQCRDREGPGNKAKSELIQHERSPDTTRKEYHLTVAAE
jgi:hypothetical protein